MFPESLPTLIEKERSLIDSLVRSQGGGNQKQIGNALKHRAARFGFRFLDFESECFGLFRISSFGFQILIPGLLGAMNFVKVVPLNI